MVDQRDGIEQHDQGQEDAVDKEKIFFLFSGKDIKCEKKIPDERVKVKSPRVGSKPDDESRNNDADVAQCITENMEEQSTNVGTLHLAVRVGVRVTVFSVLFVFLVHRDVFSNLAVPMSTVAVPVPSVPKDQHARDVEDQANPANDQDEFRVDNVCCKAVRRFQCPGNRTHTLRGDEPLDRLYDNGKHEREKKHSIDERAELFCSLPSIPVHISFRFLHCLTLKKTKCTCCACWGHCSCPTGWPDS